MVVNGKGVSESNSIFRKYLRSLWHCQWQPEWQTRRRDLGDRHTRAPKDPYQLLCGKPGLLLVQYTTSFPHHRAPASFLEMGPPDSAASVRCQSTSCVNKNPISRLECPTCSKFRSFLCVALCDVDLSTLDEQTRNKRLRFLHAGVLQGRMCVGRKVFETQFLS